VRRRPQPIVGIEHGLLVRATALPVVPTNLAAALLVYGYFNYIRPIIGPPRPESQQLVFFGAVVGILLGANVFLSARWHGSLRRWARWLREGMDAEQVPADVRRRALNAPLVNAVLTMASWLAAAVFYFPYLTLVAHVGVEEAARSFIGLVCVAGPVTAALAFLISEFYWRRQIPLFFPAGRLDRRGVLRIPIRVRMGATFLVTAVFPLLLMMIVDLSVAQRFGDALPADLSVLWWEFLRTQSFIVIVSMFASLAMALLAARFINRPVQALRAAMARVGAGDLDVSVPVRSTDELGELNEHFNVMVGDLRRASEVGELFGRYVSPEVAHQALERGVAFGGAVVHATAMFADLRGFTALTERLSAATVVELLNQYYAIVERVCAREGGIITQFLGDGVVVVFGGPLVPVADHALRAVRAAIAVQRELATERMDGLDEPLEAGIGICTGDMIAGNLGSASRVTYTVVGDAVNQAARLQVKTREFPASILVTASTYEAAAGDGIRFTACGTVPLKGIAAPVEVYAVEV
jgi:class 3 adenylate cyclase